VSGTLGRLLGKLWQQVCENTPDSYLQSRGMSLMHVTVHRAVRNGLLPANPAPVPSSGRRQDWLPLG